MQFHVLSFEGPDAYARAGGLATRVDGLTRSLAELGFDTHLWFIGDPERPGEERDGALTLHRWGTWISRHHPGGVYDGEEGKRADYVRSLPPLLLEHWIRPQVEGGGHAVVLAEEWHTVDAVLHLDWLLRRAGWRERVTILWNANNTFGFERIDWPRLNAAATVTTVSRYMKIGMQSLGCDPYVIHNGLTPDAFDPPAAGAVGELRRRFADRTVLFKMARFDPDKRWLAAVDIVGDLKRRGWRPLLVARGGAEAHGADVYARLAASGLRVAQRRLAGGGDRALLAALSGVDDADVVDLRSFVEPDNRRVLLCAANAVLANSSHEPFGLVGLEAMAAGGLACTGYSGEDYAVPGHNALVLQTGDAREFGDSYSRIRRSPECEEEMRRAGRRTAREFAWPEVIRRALLPRLESLSPALA